MRTRLNFETVHVAPDYRISTHRSFESAQNLVLEPSLLIYVRRNRPAGREEIHCFGKIFAGFWSSNFLAGVTVNMLNYAFR
jgi:hypothetical protein